MHQWGPTSSPSPCSHSKLQHPGISLSLSLSLSSCSSSSTQSLNWVFYPTFNSSLMSKAIPHQPLMLSLFHILFLLILITTDVGHCFKDNKVLILKKFDQRENSPTPRCLPQKSRREKSVAILEMKHHDSCLGPIRNWDNKLQERLISDNFRVRSLQSQIRNAASGRTEGLLEIQIPLTSGMKFQILNYIVALELGGREMTVIVDTASDLTWIQCQPCKSCYTQQDALFNPSASPSYQSIPCNSSTCQNLQFATGNLGVCSLDPPTCNYDVSYGDGSYTRGELGREQLNLGSMAVNGFIFGCGRSNHGLFGGAAGVMALGRSDLSLVSQTASQFGGVFSYCLPSTEDDSTSGSLILGNDSSVYKNSTLIAFTKMISNPQLSTFYILNLTSISIGGVALKAPGFVNGGTLIDSGTLITRLPPSVYAALRAEFLRQFSGYPLAPGFSILDTCFNLSGNAEVSIPTIRLHFEGEVEVNVDASGVFYFARSDSSQVCLALASLSSDDEIGILGNFQQKNLRVVYNTKDSVLGFAEEVCSYS